MSLIELTYKTCVLFIAHYSKHEKITYFRSKKKSCLLAELLLKECHKKATDGSNAYAKNSCKSSVGLFEMLLISVLVDT